MGNQRCFEELQRLWGEGRSCAVPSCSSAFSRYRQGPLLPWQDPCLEYWCQQWPQHPHGCWGSTNAGDAFGGQGILLPPR